MQKPTSRTNPFGPGQSAPQQQERVVDQPPTIDRLNRIQEESTLPPRKNQTKSTPQTADYSRSIPTTESKPEIENHVEFDSLKQYNSHECFMRSTVGKFASSGFIFKESNVPHGIVISPLNPALEIPVVSYSEDREIPRCYSNSCRAYINPFITWVEGGDKWICNICKMKNITEDYYFSALDKTGNRKDLGKRPEVSCGSYEFIANKTYMRKDRPQNSPTYVFVIDVSLASSVIGFLSSVIESIKACLNSNMNQYPERTNVSGNNLRSASSPTILQSTITTYQASSPNPRCTASMKSPPASFQRHSVIY